MAQPLGIGCKLILFWRLIYAILCSILLQLLIVIMFIAIINVNIFNPLIWIRNIFGSITSLHIWLILIPLKILIFGQGTVRIKDYIYERPYRTNRIMKYLSLFTIRHLFALLLHMLTGFLTTCLYLILLDEDKDCKLTSYCLPEGKFVLLLNGLWIGCYYSIQEYFQNNNRIQFPVIQQRKIEMLKLQHILTQSMKESIWPTLYFAIIYYLRQTHFHNLFKIMFIFSVDNLSSTMLEIINPFIYAYIFSTLFIFSVASMKLFFKIFLTEQWKFDIVTEFDYVLTLKDTINMKNVPIIQHLACLDLYMLAIWEPKRRQNFFTLSQPGGHPRIWNNFLQETLKLISDFTTEINLAIDSNTTPSVPTPKTEFSPNNASFQTQYQNETQLSNYNETIIYKQNFSNIRNMSLPRMDPIEIVNISQTEQLTDTIDRTKSYIIQKMNQLIHFIKTRTALDYFFGELIDLKIIYLLLKGQPIAWAVQGLSFIVTASFSEDQYGVVQKDLSVILTNLVNLKQALDKLNKFPVTATKNNANNLLITQLKHYLRTAVKRSLYNICNVFGNYMEHIHVSKEIHQQLNYFILFKEG